MAIPSTGPSPAVPAETNLTVTVFDFSFVDALHGWALGSACPDGGECALRVWATSDGGQSWLKRNAPGTKPAWNGENGQTGHVRQLRFVNRQDGWAFNPGLFSTHDGGQTWTEEKQQVEIKNITVSAGSAWAIGRQCHPDVVNGCSFSLLVANDKFQGWIKAANQPAIPGVETQLVRTSAQEAWLLSWGAKANPSSQDTQEPFVSTLIATSDGGKSWKELSNPCSPGQGASTEILSALSGGQLWLICGGIPGAGNQQKVLFHSLDNGQHWEALKPEGLGTYGYLQASRESFVFTSPVQGWLVLDRYTLLSTADGGKNWQPALDYNRVNPGDRGIGPLYFEGQHGWLGAGPLIYRTADTGKTWQAVALP
ncbi:MAG TPA: YCF48-related protein [Chloroflexia bacterium]|nr:YCF48-related protein [Chloroflexia bacterium]